MAPDSRWHTEREREIRENSRQNTTTMIPPDYFSLPFSFAVNIRPWNWAKVTVPITPRDEFKMEQYTEVKNRKREN